MNKNDLFVIYGDAIPDMVYALLTRADAAAGIPKGARIGLKPNLAVAKRADSGATTHPEIVEAVIVYLREHGFGDIRIIESSWIGDSTKRAYQLCGYGELSEKYGVPLVDVKEDGYVAHKVEGVSVEMSRQVMELDYLINFPVLKGHCQTSLTCALKNMKGCISDRSKREFHSLGLHKPIACLNKIRCADLVLADALNGDLDFEEGGNPVPMNRLLLARDSVLLDSYAAVLIGYRPEDIAYIPMAERLGVGSAGLDGANIVELNKDPLRAAPMRSGRARRLGSRVRQEQACSACYASLIHGLARLDERGRLSRLPGEIFIGQGYRGRREKGVGIGNCAAGCSRSLPGCPPRAADIVDFLEGLL